MHIIAGDSRLLVTPEMMRHTITGRLAALEDQSASEAPPFFVELTVDGKRMGLLFDTLAGRVTGEDISISGGSLTLLLRSADWAN